MITPSTTWAAYALAGIIIHLFVDWFLQNDWMAKNKMKRRVVDQNDAVRRWLDNKPILILNSHWWDRHPAAYVHSGLHFIGILLLFPWWAALIVAVTHFFIDLRTPLTWWKTFFRQTQEGDIAVHVGFWLDQVAHITVIAIVTALVV